jgi:surface protein
MKIIGSDGFPTGGAEDYEGTRKIYCKKENAVGLTPDGWEFIDVVTGEVIVPREPEYYIPGFYSGNGGIEEATTMVTEEYDNLEHMFSDCSNLRTINGINEWDTSNVTNMNMMFSSCRSLESLDLSSFNTSNVESMWGMFSGCENLKELNLSNFEVREDCDTYCMFESCNRLHTLRLDNCNEDTIRKIIESDWFPTGKAEDYEGTRQIFVKAENVGKLTAPNGWEFVDCETDEIIGGKPVNYEKDMFRDNRDIEEVSVMVTKEHDDLSDMFRGCNNLRTINGIGDWNTSNVKNMNNMFHGCESLEELILSNWDTSNVEEMQEMFKECRNLHTLELINFDMNNVRETREMFQDCERLQGLRLDNCSADTIRKMLESENFPTGEVEIDGRWVPRVLYCQEGIKNELILPDGWVFAY